LVLLDYQMPDMDGFEVAEQIAQRPHFAGATIMMLSSVGQRGDALRCRELGVAAYLSRPDPLTTQLGHKTSYPWFRCDGEGLESRANLSPQGCGVESTSSNCSRPLRKRVAD
jgi:CheY-like chemotaxis protein